MKRFFCLPWLLVIGITAVSAQESTSGDVSAQLQQIMKMLEQQQQQIKQLQEKVLQQDQIIQDQSQKLQSQNQALAEQKKLMDEQPSLNNLNEAWVHFKTGQELQHKARFDVRKKDAKLWYLKAIEEFDTVVKKFPNTPPASESAYRIGQMYHRYLDDFEKAREYYQMVLDLYPDSEKAAEAREGLGDVKGR